VLTLRSRPPLIIGVVKPILGPDDAYVYHKMLL
jgi:hypothetical protein